LRQAESGTAVAEICRKLGVSEPTFCRWKKQFAGMGTVEIRRLKQLEEENIKLKRLVAGLSLDKTMLQDVLRKMVRPALRRDVVAVLRDSYRVSERRACSAMGFHRSAQCYRSRRDPQVELRMRLRDLAAVAGPVRLSPSARAAAARGLAGEPQTRPPALH
jgi:putative transposase